MSSRHHGAPRPRVGAHRPRLIVTFAGVLVLIVAGLIWWHARPAPNIGTAAVTRLADAGSSPSPVAAPDSGAIPVVPIRPGTLPTSAPQIVIPVGISIPAIHATAAIVPTGLDPSGNVVIPSNIKTVGWYEYGPDLSATAGSMVIAGHVDTAKTGAGAFFRLRRLSPGDTFTITGSDRSTRTFRVIAREEYPKATIRLGRYFDTTGAYRVTLMTCGGSFDSATGHYRDNIAVTAVATG